MCVGGVSPCWHSSVWWHWNGPELRWSAPPLGSWQWSERTGRLWPQAPWIPQCGRSPCRANTPLEESSGPFTHIYIRYQMRGHTPIVNITYLGHWCRSCHTRRRPGRAHECPASPWCRSYHWQPAARCWRSARTAAAWLALNVEPGAHLEKQGKGSYIYYMSHIPLFPFTQVKVVTQDHQSKLNFLSPALVWIIKKQQSPDSGSGLFWFNILYLKIRKKIRRHQ